MQWFKLRPTFEIPISDSREEAMAKIDREFRRSDHGKLLMVHGEYGELHLPPEEYRVWSPHLSFYLDQRGDRVSIHGRYAPRVEVWTLVWIFYLLLANSAFFGFVLAFSQLMLGLSLWGAWIGLAALIFWGGLFVVAHIGQQWSSDQMLELRDRLEQFLRDAQVSLAEVA